MLETIIVIAIIVLAVGGATAHVIKAKKNGTGCIGCPSGGQCASHGCGCGCERPKASESVTETENKEGSCCCSKEKDE